MPIQVNWTDTAHTCLRLDFASPWDWIDYQFAIGICIREISAQDHPVDLLVIPAPHMSMPPGAFIQFRHSLKDLPANLDTICVVLEHNSIAGLFLSAFVKTYPDLCHNLILAHSLDEASLKLVERVPAVQVA
jgi:hypothetical protein